MVKLQFLHMLDTTQLCLSCPGTHSGRYACHGVGMMTFLVLAHMLDARQQCLSCPCTHAGCDATMF